MEKILWIGRPHFANALKGCGWKDAIVMDPAGFGTVDWEDLVRFAGFTPDVIVAADPLPGQLLNVEAYPALTLHYGTRPILADGECVLAQAFDACLTQRKSHSASLSGPFMPSERVLWSPPFALDDWRHDDAASKQEGVLVPDQGNSHNAAAGGFLESLRSRLVVNVYQGSHKASNYARGRIAVLQSQEEGLDTRLFEAMSAGACIVTPRMGAGLEDLFVDGEHYIGFAPDDAGDAAYRINFLLQHAGLAEYIGETASKEIDSRHRAIHRAEAFTDFICDLAIAAEDLIRQKRANAAAIKAYQKAAYPAFFA